MPLLTTELEIFLLSGLDLDREGFDKLPIATLKELWKLHGQRLTQEEGQSRKGIWRPWAYWTFELDIRPPTGWTEMVGFAGDKIMVPGDLLYLRDHDLLNAEEKELVEKYIAERPRMRDGLPQGWKPPAAEDKS